MRLFHFLIPFWSLVEAIAPIQLMILILLPNSKSGLIELFWRTFKFVYADKVLSPKKITLGRIKERWIQRGEEMVLLDMGIMFLFLEVLVDRKFFSHMLVTISDLGKIVNKIKNCHQNPSTNSIFQSAFTLNSGQRKSGRWTMRVLLVKNSDQILTTMHSIPRYSSFLQISVLLINKMKIQSYSRKTRDKLIFLLDRENQNISHLKWIGL